MIFITRAQYINISAQILNYAEYHRKSESGSFAGFFSGEEWIENPIPDGFGDANTIVGNGDLNLIVSLMGAMSTSLPAALASRALFTRFTMTCSSFCASPRIFSFHRIAY